MSAGVASQFEGEIEKLLRLMAIGLSVDCNVIRGFIAVAESPLGQTAQLMVANAMGSKAGYPDPENKILKLSLFYLEELHKLMDELKPPAPLPPNET